MRKLLAAVILFISVGTIFFINSCDKDHGSTNSEPITIIKPDSLNVMYVVSGNVQPIQIQFTTDRPLVWVKCMYEIDTPNVNPQNFPDTLFFKVLDTIPSQLSNKYTYTGSYLVPDSLPTLTNIRFDVRMKAALNPSSTDTLYYEKQFKLVVR